MPSIRKHKVKPTAFVVVDHAVLEDTSLSWAATGLLAWLKHHREGFQFTRSFLIGAKTDGRDRTLALIDELVAAGYVQKVYAENGNLRGALTYDVVDNLNLRNTASRVPEIQDTGAPDPDGRSQTKMKETSTKETKKREQCAHERAHTSEREAEIQDEVTPHTRDDLQSREAGEQREVEEDTVVETEEADKLEPWKWFDASHEHPPVPPTPPKPADLDQVPPLVAPSWDRLEPWLGDIFAWHGREIALGAVTMLCQRLHAAFEGNLHATCDYIEQKVSSSDPETPDHRVVGYLRNQGDQERWKGDNPSWASWGTLRVVPAPLTPEDEEARATARAEAGLAFARKMFGGAA